MHKWTFFVHYGKVNNIILINDNIQLPITGRRTDEEGEDNDNVLIKSIEMYRKNNHVLIYLKPENRKDFKKYLLINT